MFVLVFTAQAEEIQGRVVAVSDGETIKILVDGNRQVKVRLAEIDTPEKMQPYGNQAKQALSAMVFNKAVNVKVQTTDRYDRTVGRVYVDKLDVNAEMVRQGAAWVYRKYSKDGSLITLEGEAKRQKLGLWGLPITDQVPPWEWRHAKRNTGGG